LPALFENTADGVWISDPEGQIVFWNRAAEALLGYSAEQARGRLCRDLFAGCDSKGNRICGSPCPIRKLMKEGELVRHFDMATQTRTGQSVWLDVSCVAVPCSGDGAPAIVHIFRDVTAAHQIELLVRQQLTQTRLCAASQTPARVADLTPRELQIITLIRTGTATTAIAEQLCISKATVRNHVQNILAKLNVHTRLEAVAYVNRATRRESQPDGVE
jgi:PAS domain S-box-containing protein